MEEVCKYLALLLGGLRGLAHPVPGISVSDDTILD
jgi:hypothetical protein